MPSHSGTKQFQLHKFIDVSGRCFKPIHIENRPFAAMSQVLWAAAVFVRDFTQLGRISDTQLLKIAANLHEVYLSYGFALFF